MANSKTNQVLEEQTEFSIMLLAVGVNKVGVIKAVREITGLGLAESKSLIEKLPTCVKGGISKEDANVNCIKLKEAGAKASIV